MWFNQIFSLIDREGIIRNIIVANNYEVANTQAKFYYGEGSYSVDTTHYPVNIGCRHIDGAFYEDDGITEISKSLTVGDEASAAMNKANELEER